MPLSKMDRSGKGIGDTLYQAIEEAITIRQQVKDLTPDGIAQCFADFIIWSLKNGQIIAKGPTESGKQIVGWYETKPEPDYIFLKFGPYMTNFREYVSKCAYRINYNDTYIQREILYKKYDIIRPQSSGNQPDDSQSNVRFDCYRTIQPNQKREKVLHVNILALKAWGFQTITDYIPPGDDPYWELR